tara:strand:+ start:2149 stop:2376 length:228 start_codon:yes stop_codon:yes gene_type:complete
METLKQVEDIFANLRESNITEKDALNELKKEVSKLNREEANAIMKKMDRYQYEESLRKTVYAVCPIIYDLIKECD